MTTIVLSFIIFILAGLGLAVGLLGRKRKIRRACCQMNPSESADSPCCRKDRQQTDPQER